MNGMQVLSGYSDYVLIRSKDSQDCRRTGILYEADDSLTILLLSYYLQRLITLYQHRMLAFIT